MKTMLRIGYWLQVSLFAVGAGVMALNIYGLFMPLRAPELSETRYAPTITAEEFLLKMTAHLEKVIKNLSTVCKHWYQKNHSLLAKKHP